MHPNIPQVNDLTRARAQYAEEARQISLKATQEKEEKAITEAADIVTFLDTAIGRLIVAKIEELQKQAQPELHRLLTWTPIGTCQVSPETVAFYAGACAGLEDLKRYFSACRAKIEKKAKENAAKS